VAEDLAFPNGMRGTVVAEHERRAAREAALLACEVDVPRAGLP
jgi:hypothetical protein